MNALADSPFLTVSECARLFRCTEQTIRLHCKQGRLPAARIGGKWLIDSTGELEAPNTSLRGPHPDKNRLR